MLLSSDKPEKCGPKIEQRLRNQLGAASPLAYTTELDPDFQPVVDQFFRRAMEQLRRDGPKHLFTVSFQLTQPRPMSAHLNIVKTVQSFLLVNTVLYVSPISKSVKGAVTFGDSKRFEGDPDASARLNADKHLSAQVDKFARTQLKFSDRILTSPRYVSISAEGKGSQVAIQTMPRLTWFGMKSSFDPMVFVDLVGKIEAAL